MFARHYFLDERLRKLVRPEGPSPVIEIGGWTVINVCQGASPTQPNRNPPYGRPPIRIVVAVPRFCFISTFFSWPYSQALISEGASTRALQSASTNLCSV